MTQLYMFKPTCWHGIAAIEEVLEDGVRAVPLAENESCAVEDTQD
jgi:hypothetical protein